MLHRALLTLLLAASLPAAAASEYTDVYYTPAESGWGIFLIQSNTFQFVSFFIYGTDGRPTWYTAQLTQDAAGRYTGPLYATTGTWFGTTWNSAQLTVNPVGTASFEPLSAYTATLTYVLAGGPTVTKAIQRQTLTPYVLGGSYSGSLAGKVTGCADPANNNATVRGRFNLAVAQVGDATATLTFSFVDPVYNGTVCTLSGPLTHLGKLYQMANAQYACTGLPITPGTVTATIDALHPTGQGIEGRWTAAAGGCTQEIHFAAVIH
jgi:hypothetical protein